MKIQNSSSDWSFLTSVSGHLWALPKRQMSFSWRDYDTITVNIDGVKFQGLWREKYSHMFDNAFPGDVATVLLDQNNDIIDLEYTRKNSIIPVRDKFIIEEVYDRVKSNIIFHRVTRDDVIIAVSFFVNLCSEKFDYKDWDNIEVIIDGVFDLFTLCGDKHLAFLDVDQVSEVFVYLDTRKSSKKLVSIFIEDTDDEDFEDMDNCPKTGIQQYFYDHPEL